MIGLKTTPTEAGADIFVCPTCKGTPFRPDYWTRGTLHTPPEPVGRATCPECEGSGIAQCENCGENDAVLKDPDIGLCCVDCNIEAEHARHEGWIERRVA